MANDYKVYQCAICGFEYNEAEGLPDNGIEAGTRWADIPEEWLCPECSVGKEDFKCIES